MRNGPVNYAMRAASAAFLVLMLLGWTVPAQKRGEKRAARVSHAPITNKTAPTASAEPASVGLTFEKYSADYYLNSDGTGVQTIDIQQKCANEPCLEQIKKLKREYNGDLSQIKVLERYIIGTDGKKTQLPAEAVQDRKSPQAEAAPGFSSLREVEIAFDGVAVGSSVGAKVEIRTLKPIYGTHFSGMEFFPLLFDWKAVEINVSTPADHPIYVDAFGLQDGKNTQENGRINWHWSAKDLQSIPMEPLMSDIIGASPRLVFSTIKDYDELGRAFREGVLRQAVITPEVKSLADEITTGITDQRLQASAIYTWVNKNIRYLQVYVDRDGWIPHNTSQILSTRYGDCKDYTTLIYSLLKAKGIESIPSLIRADGSDWFPSVPSLYYFNHAILYVPGLDAIADATVPNTRLGVITPGLVGKKVLLADEKPRIYDVPKNDPGADDAEGEIDVTFAEDGSLKADSKEKHSGRRETVSRGLLGSPNAMDPTFIKLLFTFIGIDASGRMVRTSDPSKIDEPFTFEVEAEMANFTTFQRNGSLRVPFGVNLQNILMTEQFFKAETRQTKLLLGAQRSRETYRIHLPASVTITTLPASVKIENSVGKFTVDFERIGDGVKVTRELVTFQDMVTPQDYPKVKELFSKAVASQKQGIDYTSSRATVSSKIGKGTKDLSAVDKEDDLYVRLKSGVDEKPLTSNEVKQLETLLKTQPDDFQARTKLARYYSNTSQKDTPAREALRLSHRLWFVRTHPELSDGMIFGWMIPFVKKDSKEYQALREEWLKQVAVDKNNSAVRLNAIQFLSEYEPDAAMGMLKEGESLDPNNYKFPFGIATVLKERYESKERSAEQKRETGESILSEGEKALGLIKRDRSAERDDDRLELLKELCIVAADLAETSRARSFARELILDFGPSATVAGSASAVHIGNITMGRAELADGNVAKAKEHLLIAMRAALRLSSDDMGDLDTRLAADLFAKGEKEAIIEYFKLSLERGRFKKYPDLYKNDILAVNQWISAMQKGETPTFDFRTHLPKAVAR